MSDSVARPVGVRETGRALAIEPSVALVSAGLFIAVVGTAAPHGSYFPSSWGWASLAFLWAGAIALAVRRTVSLSRLEVAYLVAWLALLAWIGASLLWSPTATHTMYEVERAIIYVSFASVLALVGRRSIQALLPALLAGIVAVAIYALATRLLPERVGTFDSFVGYRLSEPLGYWNALSVFVAIGIVVAVGLAAHAHSITLRALSAASLVLLFPVLYFTFGRGGWIAVASGLAAAILVDPRRLRLVTTLLVILPWPAVALWRAYESPSLTTQYSALEDATEEGARLAVTLGVLALVSAAVVTGYALLAERVTVGRGVRRMYAAVLVLALLGCVAGVIAAYGGPVDSARRAVDSIRQSSPNVTGDQTKRLFSLSAHHRAEIWESALEDAQANPVLGSGAGTFERWWLEHRDEAHKVRDAHSLYLETLAELGPGGLALLAAVIALPFAAAVRARRHPLVAPALAGFVALVVHAGVDWDWEFPAVMVAGLTCAGVLLLVDRGERPHFVLGAHMRAVLLIAIGALAVLSFATLTSNRYLGEAGAALTRTDGPEAARSAARAENWAPWSTDALERQADAALLKGDVDRARQFYTRAISKDSGDWELWLGLALASEGDARRQAFRRAAALNPLGTEIQQLGMQLGVRNSP
jgi:O-Antigen ligase